jgi:multiple sugar transport system permease protein
MRKSTPYLLLTPALLFTAFVLAYPLVQNLLNSFREMSLVKGTGGWAGIGNYANVFQDALFWLSIRNTVIYAFVGTALALLIGLAFALLLNEKIGKVTGVVGFLYAIPWVVSPVVAGFAWKWLLNDTFGIANYWLVSSGILKKGLPWLGDPQTALLCVAVARVWQFYPFAMVMFLAGLQTIPKEQYEAAAVDGTSPLRAFYSITLPNLRSVTSVLVVLGVIWSFNDFNMVFVMTRGGPINASMVLPVLVREYSFVQFDVGKGSALSMLMFGLLISLSFIYLKVLSRRESR